MPIIQPDRFDQEMTRYYYRQDDKYHGPALDWYDNSGAKPHVEKFLNKLLVDAGKAAVQSAIPGRTMFVSMKVPIFKAANVFWGGMDASHRTQEEAKGLNPQVLQIAFENALEEGGYIVENGHLLYELRVPPLEIVDEEEEVDSVVASSIPGSGGHPAVTTEASQSAAATPQATQTPAAPPDDDDDLEALATEVSNLEETSVVIPPTETLREAPIKKDAIYKNGTGSIHRRVDTLNSDAVTYTVVRGTKQIKEGSTGSSTYKSFLSWAKGGRVEVTA